MKIDRDNDFDGAVLNCAVRYALGRMSYMPCLVIQQITPLLKDCSDKTLWCFSQDITDWFADGADRQMQYGDRWLSFLQDVKHEMHVRSCNDPN